MRLAPLLASALALALVSSAASAVTEPNGLQVPLDGMNGEIELYSFFPSRSEAINWLTDAHTTPDAFSPLCGFTATFVLNQAGSHFGLAWYNETGMKPQPNELHQLLPPNSPVGAMFNGTAIKNDPAYAGGLIGFALMGGQVHYTNPQYNPQYGPNQPWILSLIYASTVTANAYYIAFEDGNVNGTNFSNDGDFNDDVFFLTGITCSGGGQPCDTGKPGICGPGITQCTANGIVCQQLSQPAATETCNGLDDNCDGTTDEGAVCPAGFICDKGTCVQSCAGGEFKCPSDKVCNADGNCVDPSCNNVTCPSGQVCVQGLCKGPCDGVTCPHPQVCRVGACVDPCAGVTCDASQVCDNGVCVARCDCLPCAMAMACDPASGLCGDPACVGKPACGPGTYCSGGNCVDACTGAVCPTGEACMAGACVAVQGGTGGAGSTSSGGLAVGVGGAGAAGGNGAGGAKATGGGHAGGSGGSGGSGTGSKGKCGCAVVGAESEGDELAWLALAALGMVAARRRR